MRRVLYDTNVLLDVLLKREPHFAASAAALDAVGQGRAEGYVAGHAVTTLAYILQRELGRARGRNVLAHLLSRLRVAPVTDAVVRQALASGFEDIEDAVCHGAAQEVGITVIVTRNVRHFRGSAIPAVLPEALRSE